jgi:hypothetical protein
MIVNQIIPMSLELIVGNQRELYNQIARLLCKPNITFSRKPNFFFTRCCSHSRSDFYQSGNSDYSFISSVINSLDLIELDLLLASEKVLFECAGDSDLKVLLGRTLLSSRNFFGNLLKSSNLVAFLI